MSAAETQFELAIWYYTSSAKTNPGAKSFSDQDKFKLCGLFQRATAGVAPEHDESKGEKTMQQTEWEACGSLSKEEAMAKYVSIIAESEPDWEEHAHALGHPLAEHLKRQRRAENIADVNADGVIEGNEFVAWFRRKSGRGPEEDAEAWKVYYSLSEGRELTAEKFNKYRLESEAADAPSDAPLIGALIPPSGSAAALAADLSGGDGDTTKPSSGDPREELHEAFARYSPAKKGDHIDALLDSVSEDTQELLVQYKKLVHDNSGFKSAQTHIAKTVGSPADAISLTDSAIASAAPALPSTPRTPTSAATEECIPQPFMPSPQSPTPASAQMMSQVASPHTPTAAVPTVSEKQKAAVSATPEDKVAKSQQQIGGGSTTDIAAPVEESSNSCGPGTLGCTAVSSLAVAATCYAVVMSGMRKGGGFQEIAHAVSHAYSLLTVRSAKQ